MMEIEMILNSTKIIVHNLKKLDDTNTELITRSTRTCTITNLF